MNIDSNIIKSTVPSTTADDKDDIAARYSLMKRVSAGRGRRPKQHKLLMGDGR